MPIKFANEPKICAKLLKVPQLSEQDPAVQLFGSLLSYRHAHQNFKQAVNGQANSPVVQFLEICGRNVHVSQSRLFQDLFVTFCTKGKKMGSSWSLAQPMASH